MFVSVGCGGAGVLRGTSQGKLLADLAAGVGSQLLTDRLNMTGPNWIPPDPSRGSVRNCKLRLSNSRPEESVERRISDFTLCGEVLPVCLSLAFPVSISHEITRSIPRAKEVRFPV